MSHETENGKVASETEGQVEDSEANDLKVAIDNATHEVIYINIYNFSVCVVLINSNIKIGLHIDFFYFTLICIDSKESQFNFNNFCKSRFLNIYKAIDHEYFHLNFKFYVPLQTECLHMLFHIDN